MTDPLIGQTLGGRYRIERLLGAGGMGAVYEAIQTDIKRRVAVKILHVAKATPEERTRFEREARALTAIHSPHVVEIRDFQIPPDGPPFLVMEYLEGQSLSALVKRDGALAPERVAKIALQVLTALTEVHRLDIVHRDVKPANVVLVPSAALGEIVKLVDFGVSTADVTMIPATLGTAFVGTLPYMAPEQAMGEGVDGRSDVYGVGASMYYACTLRRPVEGDTPAAIVQQLLKGAVTPIASLRPELDPTFARIVDRALAHDPAMRWQSAAEMAKALVEWLDPAAPKHEPPPPPSALPTRVLSEPMPAAPARKRARAPTVAVGVGVVAFAAIGALVVRSSVLAPQTPSVAQALDASVPPPPSMVILEPLSSLTPSASASAHTAAATVPTAPKPMQRAAEDATTVAAPTVAPGTDPHATGKPCGTFDMCPGSERCVRGQCHCWGGRVWCGGDCIMMDVDNCGACSHRCPLDTVCLPLDGSGDLGCVTCDVLERREHRPAGTMKACGGRYCLDLLTNSLNCGACGHACDPSRHETCTAGKCVAVY